jgi:hypothetical protein
LRIVVQMQQNDFVQKSDVDMRIKLNGWQRIGIAVSVIWVIGAVWFQLISLDLICRSGPCQWGAMRVRVFSDFVEVGAWIIIPPLIIFVVGYIVAWIRRGFRQNQA